jgi:uncharacterized membrane protein
MVQIMVTGTRVTDTETGELHRYGRRVALAVVLVVGAAAIGVGLGPATADSHGDSDESTVVGEFRAVGTNGSVAVNAESLEADPIPLTPEGLDQPIVIEGEIFANGTWRSTEVSFSDLNPSEVDVPVRIELESAGTFRGQIDRDAGFMTANGTLRVIVPDADTQIDVTAELTTETSGALEGTAEGLGTESATATLVDNQFTLPDSTGSPIIDSVIGLPAPEPGTNWFELKLSLNFQTKTGTVSGVVESGGDPVADATVTAGSAETTTGSDGSYSLDVGVGTREVTIEKLGFGSASQSVTVTDNETTTADFELESAQTGTVSGVVESTEGEPVAGATVAVGSQETTTGADGSFELDAGAGSQQLTANAEGFSSATRSVTVTPGETTTVTVQLEPGQASFNPVIVFAGDSEAGDTVTATGLVQNTGNSAGTGEVTLTAGSASTTETLTLAPGELRQVSLDWTTTVDDEGTHEVTLSAGERTASTEIFVAGPEFNVTISAPNAAPGETATITATVRNDGLVAGAQNVTVSVADESVTDLVELRPGQRRTVTLNWTTTAEDNGSYDATAETEDDSVTETILIRRNVQEGADFIARSTGGYMSYDDPGYSDAQGGGLAFPDVNAGEDPIVIAGKINEENGTWTSVDTFFPEVTQEGLTGQVRAPNGLSGKIDRDEGLLTASGLFQVFIQEAPGTSFEFDLTMTTADSGPEIGAIPGGGTYEEVNNSFADIRFVSNNYAVTDQTGDGLVDSTLSLPSPEPSRNFMELGFEVNFDPPENTSLKEQEELSTEEPETEPNGQLFATLGQGVGAAGVIGGLLFVLTGLYGRVGTRD